MNLLFTEGLSVLIVLTLLFALAWWNSWKSVCILLIISILFCFYFFRNPSRGCPAIEEMNTHHHLTTPLVCPADGKIVEIRTQERMDDFEEPYARISIFLSLWDAHVTWSPVAGTIETICYHPGTFMFAFLPKSSIHNERNDITIRTLHNTKIILRQIAGTIARTISCWVHQGDTITPCQKIGMIRFGSRVDLLVPSNSVTWSVEEGQQVYGGHTVLGYIAESDHRT